MQQNQKYIIILLFLISIPSFSLKLTLDDVIKKGTKNDNDVKNAKIYLDDSKIQIKKAYKSLGPSIDYTGQYDRSENNIYYENLNYHNHKYTHSFDLNQPIFLGGKLVNNILISKNTNEIKKYELKKSIRESKLKLTQKYIDILKLYEENNVYESSLKELTKEEEGAEKKLKVGLLSKSQVMPFKIQLIDNKTNILEIQNNIIVAEEELKNYLNIKEDFKIIAKNNEKSKISKINIDIANLKKRESIGNFLPQIYFNLGYGSESNELRNTNSNWQWHAGITFKLNIFSMGRDIDDYILSKNQKEIYINNDDKIKGDIKLQLRKYYSTLIVLNGNIEKQKLAVEIAKENLNLERKRYQNKLSSVLDYLKVEDKLKEVKLNLVKLQFDYYMMYEKYITFLKD